MKLEVTICHKLLEKCFVHCNPFIFNEETNNAVDEIKKRRVVLSSELEKIYDEHFGKNISLKKIYQDFLTSILYCEEHSTIVSITKEERIDKIISDENQKILANTCLASNDKILLFNKNEDISEILKGNIFSDEKAINFQELLDIKKEHFLNLYRLPITAKNIKSGADAHKVSFWLSRFIIEEDSFIILDRYIYSNIENFHTYFLKYVKPKSKIKIYTFINKVGDDKKIALEFSKSKYKKWSFEIYSFTDKEEQHDRVIYTNKYKISIGMGFGFFDGIFKIARTRQSEISIKYIDTIEIPTNIKKII